MVSNFFFGKVVLVGSHVTNEMTGCHYRIDEDFFRVVCFRYSYKAVLCDKISYIFLSEGVGWRYESNVVSDFGEVHRFFQEIFIVVDLLGSYVVSVAFDIIFIAYLGLWLFDFQTENHK